MTSLHQHIQNQQDIAMNLCGVLEALSVLDSEGVAPGAVTSLVNVARNLADALSENLDSVKLPKVAA